jgi:hypothetical protein
VDRLRLRVGRREQAYLAGSAPCPSRDIEAGLAQRSSACGSRRVKSTTGYARRRPRRSLGNAGSIPATSKRPQMLDLSPVGSGEIIPIAFEDFVGPHDGILEPNSRRLWAYPELKVLWPVVVSYPISMMHAFRWKKAASEQFFHYEDVLKDVAVTRSGMVREPHHEIASLVPGATASPVAVRDRAVFPAGRAARRLDLLWPTTGTGVLRTAGGAAKMLTRW